jgi:signal transduction histidine kinase
VRGEGDGAAAVRRPRLRLVDGSGRAREPALRGSAVREVGTREPIARHPLTTRDAPLLPPRGAPGALVDVWEELDAAAAWVAAEWPASGRENVRQALRVLCVALRARAALGESPDGTLAPAPALRLGDVPWEVPVDDLAARLRRRLVAQAATPGRGAGADPAAVLALAAALDGVEGAARSDGARAVVEQLGGAHALELLVEVAHDMRSPLGSILFLVERVRTSGAVDAAADRQLALVHGAAFGLSTLVSDVMELARGGDRLARTGTAPFRVAAVLDAVRAILAPVAEEKGLALEVATQVTGDADATAARLGRAAALERVLLNLATNALKFTPQGTVTVRAAAAGAGRVRFEVADTGPGIPAAVQAELFQTFRGHVPASSRGAHGTVFSSAGLGLAISQRLVAALGAALEVHTAPGEGTRFTFEVPLPPVA